MAFKIFTRKKISLVLALAFIGFLVWSSVAFQNLFTKIVPFFEHLSQQDKALSVIVFILLGAASTMLSSFSSVPLVPIAIIVWGAVPTGIYLFIGWLLGDVLSYYVGYYAGNPIAKKLLPFEKIKVYLKKIPPDAEFKFILLFILSMPSEIPGYTIGILRYRITKYFFATAINEIIFASLTAYMFRGLVDKRPAIFLGSVIFGVAIFSYMFYLFQKQLRKRD